MVLLGSHVRRFLVLAQAPGGLSCFLLPRWRPDGTKNALRLMRLKDKLGDWSNASSEVEFADAWAYRIGDEGRGVATIIEMVMLTRLDCMLGSSAEMRMALAQAIHHARYRRTFGKRLCEHALMRNVLADLALEAEAALALSMRVARAVAFVNEAQECLSGAGYVEESILPRLYRQAPPNSIWEGSGNIQCLDVLRALVKEPETSAALLREVDAATGLHAAFDGRVADLRQALAKPDDFEVGARLLVERMALVLQAAVLLRAGSPNADAFCRSRLAGAHGLVFGTLPADADFGAMIDRAFV